MWTFRSVRLLSLSDLFGRQGEAVPRGARIENGHYETRQGWRTNRAFVFLPSFLPSLSAFSSFFGFRVPVLKIRPQWNTYGDPPNAHLLRRYGHVDLVSLPSPLEGEGNPEDVVEIRADLLVAATPSRATADSQERIDWWLEFAEDEYVRISYPPLLSPPFPTLPVPSIV